MLAFALLLWATATHASDEIILPEGPVRLWVSDMDMTLLSLAQSPTLSRETLGDLKKIRRNLKGFYVVTGSQDWLATPKLLDSRLFEVIDGAFTDGGLRLLRMENGKVRSDPNYTKTLKTLAKWQDGEAVRDAVLSTLKNRRFLQVRPQDKEFQDPEFLATRVWIDGSEGAEGAAKLRDSLQHEVTRKIRGVKASPIFTHPAFDHKREVYAVDVTAAAKDTAVRAIAEMHGVPRLRIVASGDAGNDGVLARASGFFVAPGNARPELFSQHLSPLLEAGSKGLVHVVRPHRRDAEHLQVEKGTLPGVRLLLGLQRPRDPRLKVHTNHIYTKAARGTDRYER